MLLTEFFKAKTNIFEGANLSSQSPGWQGRQDVAATEIDLKVHNRSHMVKLFNELLHAVQNTFQKQFKTPLWSPELLASQQFLGGSSLHFFNIKGISDEEFVKRKPKLGDIDTQCNKELEPEVHKFLTGLINKHVGNATFLGFSRGNEQYNGLFLLDELPVTIQIDFEFGQYDPKTNAPDDWYRFSHSSAWEDIELGVKGVMHKYIYRALAKAAPTKKYIAQLAGRGKARQIQITGPETDANFSFSVSSGSGGGVRAKYKPYIDPTTGQAQVIKGIPVMTPVDSKDSEYIQDIGQQFELFFGRPPEGNDSQLQGSFIGTLELINKYLNANSKKIILNDFLNIVFEPGAQMITKADPARDREIKFAAIDLIIEKLGLKALRPQAVQMAKAYEQDYNDVEAYKKANPTSLRPRADMMKARASSMSENFADGKNPGRKGLAKRSGVNTKASVSSLRKTAKHSTGEKARMAHWLANMKAGRQKANESLNEAEVKAQFRKGMPHLHDLKAVDFLDLLDEIHDGNGKFKLENIPLNVKVDGFGGRFGKDAEGKPFMGTSRTEPRYKAGFLKYHQEKGTNDPEILSRAQKFDELFEEMMNAIKLVDSKLGPDFLVNKQVTCEVLFLPFATQTPEGRLKFVGIHYDKLPEGVQLALVPFHAVEADTGEAVQDPNFINELLKVGQQGSVMFVNNRLVQKEGLDVTEIINVLDNIEELKSIVSSTHGKRDRASLELRKQVEAKLQPVKDQLEQAIINDPNIIGKDMLGKDYEGIVINSRLGPIKVTSQEQRDVISAKQAAKTAARTEHPREDANKTAVVAIGSFVGHIGHQQLWDYTLKKAQQVGGTPYLFIGNAEGKNDPIPVATKVETWHKMYPEYAKNISAVMQGGSIMQKIKHELINPLPGKPPRYDNIIIMVGEDQAKMPIAQALMKAVNKFQGYEHVKVALEVTPRGTGMSFTKLRNILMDVNATPQQQFALWAKAFDVKKLGKEWILHLMDLTRKGMGVTKPHISPSGVKTNMSPKDDDYAINYGKQGMAEAGRAGFRAGDKKRHALNAMSDEERRAYDTAQQEKKRKRDDARLERERQKNNTTEGSEESKVVKIGEGWSRMIADAIALLEKK